MTVTSILVVLIIEYSYAVSSYALYNVNFAYAMFVCIATTSARLRAT
jgi:hypothetical protein